MNAINLSNRVAIVTGAGQGLGRAHALALAARGAKLVVNDLGDDSGASESAEAVADEIRRSGGDALAHGANVARFDEVEDMVEQAMGRWGSVDILVNNAGILRDKSFAKMSMSDFHAVIEVHLMGSANCTKAVWAHMREQAYGRIVFTTSGTGLYGNFGQANYAAAKMAMLGLMNTLHIEGERYDIRVNCVAPTAGTAMLKGLVPDEVFSALSPESVSPGVIALVGPDAPSRTVLCAGGGSFALYKGFETLGVTLAATDNTPETLLAQWEDLDSESGMLSPGGAFEQTERFAENHAAVRR